MRLLDIEYETLWMAMKYACHRRTISCSNMPQMIIFHYGVRISTIQRKKLFDALKEEEQFSDIDMPLKVDFNWLKLMAFLDDNTHVSMKHKDRDGDLLFFTLNGIYYPVMSYCENPYIDTFIDEEDLRNWTKID